MPCVAAGAVTLSRNHASSSERCRASSKKRSPTEGSRNLTSGVEVWSVKRTLTAVVPRTRATISRSPEAGDRISEPERWATAAARPSLVPEGSTSARRALVGRYLRSLSAARGEVAPAVVRVPVAGTARAAQYRPFRRGS
eukprot:3507606-Rhodomonas_salina.2